MTHSVIRYIKSSRSEARYEIAGIVIYNIPVGFIFLA